MMRETVRADRVELQVWETVRRAVDDKHYVLNKMKEHFAKQRHELSKPGADARALIRLLDDIDKSWIKFQKAYEADALSVADLKARPIGLHVERRQVKRELERTRNRDAELERLNADEAETRRRIEEAYGSLNDAPPEKRRQVYEDLDLWVVIGLERIQRIYAFFPIGTTESDRNTATSSPPPNP